MALAIFSSLAKILVILIVVKQTLSGNANKTSAIISLVAFLACIISLIAFQELVAFDSIETIGVIFAFISPLIIFRNIQKRQSIYLTALALGLTSAIVTTARWTLYAASSITVDAVKFDLVANLILLVLCIIGIKKGAFKKAFYNVILLRWHLKMLMLLTIWISALLASLFSFFFSTYDGLPGFALIGFFTALLIILAGIMCPLLITKNLSSSYYENLAENMDKQLQVQVAHYEAMAKRNEDIKRFRHDYKNLQVGLVSALRQNNISGALTLLETDEMALAEPVNSFETGNTVLDALLSEKQLSAATVNASLEFDGVVPGNLLNPIDICVIFGNALDNAIEACERCPHSDKKAIVISSTFTNGFLFMTIMNPIATDVKIINNAISTTKADKSAHGIGLRSIRTAIEKYSGSMTLSCNADICSIFCLEIELDFNMLAET